MQWMEREPRGVLGRMGMALMQLMQKTVAKVRWKKSVTDALHVFSPRVGRCKEAKTEQVTGHAMHKFAT